MLARFAPALDAGPDAGGWDARHHLSHLVGSWQRVPIRAAFFLDDVHAAAVPIRIDDPYWLDEWEGAPLVAFTAAMEAAYEGAKAFLRRLDPARLAEARWTRRGDDFTLAEVLLGTVEHIAAHVPRLEAFLPD